jgi:uncharacterized protein YtpQ (UPF0354 family)
LKRIFASFLWVAGLIGRSKTTLAPAAFTVEYAAKLREALPQAKVEIAGDLKLRITGHSREGGVTAFLQNCYTEYRSSPKDKEATISKYIKSFSETSFNTDKIDTTRITPVIKSKAWVSETQVSLRSHGAKMTPENVYENLNDELLIVYVEDNPKSVRYLTPKDILAVGLKKEQLKGLAVKNFRLIVPPVEVHEYDGFYVLRAGGHYDASLLLLDEIWATKKMVINGDYVVAVPSRDMLLVTGSNNPSGVANVTSLAKETFAESPFRITPDLFTYKEGRLIKYTR